MSWRTAISPLFTGPFAMVMPYALLTCAHCLLSSGAWEKFLPGNILKGKWTPASASRS
jgi:hypothetical protein